jgi:tetratricopeptide (TPR) repeat protein
MFDDKAGAARKSSRRPRPRSILNGWSLADLYFRDVSGPLSEPLQAGRGRQELFEQSFFEEILAGAPDHVPTLEALAHLYTRLGRHSDGLALDERIVRLRPDRPVAHYNLACSYALLGRLEEAFEALARAVARGYRDFEHLQHDPDMAAVRADPRYPAFLVSLRSGSGVARTAR